MNRNESPQHGRGEPRRSERGRHQARDVQGDAEEDPGDATVPADGSARQLRSRAQRVLLRPASRRLCAGP